MSGTFCVGDVLLLFLYQVNSPGCWRKGRGENRVLYLTALQVKQNKNQSNNLQWTQRALRPKSDIHISAEGGGGGGGDKRGGRAPKITASLIIHTFQTGSLWVSLGGPKIVMPQHSWGPNGSPHKSEGAKCCFMERATIRSWLGSG